MMIGKNVKERNHGMWHYPAIWKSDGSSQYATVVGMPLSGTLKQSNPR